MAVPRATYRLQFQEGLGFDDAANLAPYLARLGISHVYASPYLMARPGSTHGYDIVDHERLNPELGDEAAFARMATVLHENRLGQVLDLVPNHMGVGGFDNPLWLNVLEWGPELGLCRLVRHRIGSRTGIICGTSCWYLFSATNTDRAAARSASAEV